MGVVVSKLRSVKGLLHLNSRTFVAILVAYLSSKLMVATAFADADTDMFMNHVDRSGGKDTFANVFAGFIGPLMSFAAVVLVLSAIVCGMKIGTAAMFGDPRARMEAIVGLFFIIIGAVVVIHAKQLIGMAGEVSVQNS
ncbi:hypothetical protein QUW45_08880 [Limosilactobacillus pontis]|uniref:hypothetical protein n=1 Tax=Limosilactobacillus pontis TaxID=35787 RepID=UPI0025A3402C|nr:hypothetical protein [Limosilactobacillus pontis]MDM8332770.1 hypothetical protein [Limosilactobacillus pontis]